MPKLNTYVHVLDPSGQTREFGPADQLPEWAVDKITNPDVWAEAPSAAREPKSEPPPPAPEPAAEEKPETAKRPARRTAKAGN